MRNEPLINNHRVDKTLLPAAVMGDKSVLSETARAEIRKYLGARPIPFTLQLMLAWLIIVGVISWAVWMGAIWATIVAIFIVATRQNILGLLVHEQAHLPNQLAAFGISGGSNGFSRLFMSHPPLEERIAALEARH